MLVLGRKEVTGGVQEHEGNTYGCGVPILSHVHFSRMCWIENNKKSITQHFQHITVLHFLIIVLSV